MKTLVKRIELHWYMITVVVAIAMFIIEDARPSHVLDSPFLYGFVGHTLIFFASFFIALYLGVSNAYLKWLYPFFVALNIHFVIPFVDNITRPYAAHFYIYYFPFGYFLIFMPHIFVPTFGVVLGNSIYKQWQKK